MPENAATNGFKIKDEDITDITVKFMANKPT
jgi:hypothetical protein